MAPPAAPPITLTVPGRMRPYRAGIFNIWEYDDQIFEFAGGRMVLRGRNGSGKSNALSLLFPFILDGVMSAARMDPMGGARSMKSLLLGRSDEDGGGRYRHESGTGYVWMEFGEDAGTPSGAPGGEADSDGGSRRLTIGVGASATTQRDADSWFFVAHGSVGVDFDLHDDDTPKTRRRLAETIGDGSVMATAEEYRNAVDRELLGLGADRYRILVDLLLTLRRPHLAGKLDTEHLSQTLSAGLADIDSALVDDVAHSFDDLDAMQSELDGLRASLDAVEQFLPLYRDHLVGVGRQRSAALVEADRRRRSVRKDLATAASERDAANDAVLELRAVVAAAEATLKQISVEIDTIRDSPAYQSVAALDEARRGAELARQHAITLAAVADDARRRAQQSIADRDRARVAAEEARTRAGNETGEWSVAARSVGINDVIMDVEAASFPADAARTATAQRRLDIDAVIVAADGSANAARAAAHALDNAERVRTAATDAADAADAADRDVAQRRQELRAERVEWAERTDPVLLAIAEVTGVEIVSMSLLTRSESLRSDAANEITTTGTTGADQSADANHDLRSTYDADPDVGIERSIATITARYVAAIQRSGDLRHREIEAQREAIAAIDRERQVVIDEPNPGPPVNPTRPDADAERPGAPLFVCVDFAQSVPDRDRAGLEAALGASGVLDARILPDKVDDDLGLDAHLVVDQTSGMSGGATLSDLLVAVPFADLDAARIDEVLAAIPVDSETVCVRADGSWRLGPLAGRFGQDAPRYIGHEARERRRAQRVADLDAALEAEHVVLDELLDAARHIDRLGTQLAELEVAFPPTSELSSAVRVASSRHAVAEDRRLAADDAEAEAERDADTAQQASAELARLAIARRLPSDINELHLFESRLASLIGDIARLVERTEGAARLASDADDAAGRAVDDVESAGNSANGATSAEHDADNLNARFEDLRRDVGGDAEEAERKLHDARTRHHDTESRRTEANDHLRTHELRVAELRSTIASLDEQRDRTDEVFSDAAAAVVPLCSHEVASTLTVEGVAADVEPLAAAKKLLAGTTQTDAVEATAKMTPAYQSIVLGGLRHGNDPTMPKLDGFDVVRVRTTDGEIPIAALGDQLRADDERIGNLLSTKEREIFETHLLTNIGDEIRRLLLAADAFQHRINEEMAKTPTESGLRVELAWNVEADEPGLRNAVSLLRRSPDVLGLDEREVLRSFFVGRISDVRADDPGGSFSEALTTALDYRTWHRFDLFARFTDGKRRRITRAFFRELSGGEAAAVLHLPLFASAAAQYSSGDVAGPRIVALDEAFVGIDEQMRGRLMGLLVELDLDVIVTSHEFWGFYDQVPDLVTYDLVRDPSSPGVFSQRFDWKAT